MQAEYWAVTIHVGPSLDQHFDRGGVGVDRWLRAGNPSHSGLAASHLAFCLAIILLFLHLPSTELIRDPQWRALPPVFTRLTSISVHPLVEITISTNGRTEIQVKLMEIRKVLFLVGTKNRECPNRLAEQHCRPPTTPSRRG